MIDNPEDRVYAETHEWAKLEETGEVTVGITEYAQDMLGDLVFADLPEIGDGFEMGEVCMILESVKAAADITMPISGEVSTVNTALVDNEPGLVNQDPFEEGWLFSFIPNNPADLNNLLLAADYDALLDA